MLIVGLRPSLCGGERFLFDVHFLQPNIFFPQTDVKMPKVTEKSHKTTYPPGCKELHEGLSTDELLKRLKV